MREILRTNDPVLLSFSASILSDAGIAFRIADQHMSVLEGSIGIFPRRLLVEACDQAGARRALTAAGLGASLLAADPAGAVP